MPDNHDNNLISSVHIIKVPGPSPSLLSYSYTLIAHHWQCVSGVDVLPLHGYDGQILSGFPLFAILGLCMHVIDSSGSSAFKEMEPQPILPVWCQRCTAIYQMLIQHSLSSDKSTVHIVSPYCFHLSHVPSSHTSWPSACHPRQIKSGCCRPYI